MIVYLSGVKSWYTYFMRGLPRDGSVPFPADVTLLDSCFPSYWDFTSKDGTKVLPVQPGRRVILDSGAHSFFSMVGMSVHVTYRKKTDVVLEDYFKKYLRFLEKNWDVFNYFVELDVADVFGMEAVQKMRRAYKSKGMMEKMIPGWHPVNGKEDFFWQLKCPSHYIGMQGLRPGKPTIPYGPFIRECYDKGVRVHGFALLNQRLLREYPFYSIDSTTWLTPVQYNRQLSFDNGRLKATRIGTTVGSMAFTQTPSIGVTLKGKDRLRLSIQAVHSFESYITDYWEQRGVDWSDQLEKFGVQE